MKPRLPKEWSYQRLDSLASVQTGVAKNSGLKGETVELPYLRVANVQDGHIDLTEIKTIRVLKRDVARFSLRNNDIVVTEGGDFDKLGRGFLWHGQVEPCLHQNHVFAVRPNPARLLPAVFAYLTSSDYGRAYFQRCAKRSTNLASINSSQLKSFPVPLPPPSEQRKIAEILGEWDTALGTLDRLITAKERRQRGRVQRLLSSPSRLTEHKKDAPWCDFRLGELFTERVETNREELPLLAITASEGVIPRNELNKKDTSAADKSRYLRICPGDIGYNTMRMWQGVSGLSAHEGIISPAYTVVIPGPRIDGRFAAYLFKFPPVVHRFWRHSQGLVDDTLNLKFPHFAQVHVTIPSSLAEQRRIADFLDAADSELRLLRKQREALADQKHGLMQLLLTGKKRVRV